MANISCFSTLTDANHASFFIGKIIFREFRSFQNLNGIKTSEFLEEIHCKCCCIIARSTSNNYHILNFTNLLFEWLKTTKFRSILLTKTSTIAESFQKSFWLLKYFLLKEMRVRTLRWSQNLSFFFDDLDSVDVIFIEFLKIFNTELHNLTIFHLDVIRSVFLEGNLLRSNINWFICQSN